jgi:hypothetical protein
MRILALLLVLGMGWVLHGVAGEKTCPTNAPAVIALRDQFEVTRTLKFPTTNLTFLTIADKAGSEQIAAWVGPVKQRFGEQVAIEGIADVSAVPRPFRGMVRRKFQKAQSHPVMLDWSGDTVKAFATAADQANVFVLDQQGKILKRLNGKATEQSLDELCAAIEQALADAKKRMASR